MKTNENEERKVSTERTSPVIIRSGGERRLNHIFSEYYILLEKSLNWERLIEEEPQTVFIIASWVEAHMDFQSIVKIFI